MLQEEKDKALHVRGGRPKPAAGLGSPLPIVRPRGRPPLARRPALSSWYCRAARPVIFSVLVLLSVLLVGMWDCYHLRLLPSDHLSNYLRTEGVYCKQQQNSSIGSYLVFRDKQQS
jgi:hypothetical protein